MPLISVIVPVYKVEKYIHRCVNSILAQSFPDFEIILVDDGSPDNCGAICDEYALQDSRIHVIHQENSGLSAARNAGLDWLHSNSDSEWVTFLDSDDWLHTQFLEILYESAHQCNCFVSAGNPYITSGHPLPALTTKDIRCMLANDYYCSDNYGGYQATAWGKLYHRSLFLNLRFPVSKLHEDEFTTYQAIYAAERIAVTDAALYAYYQNQTGIMRSTWNPRRLDALEALMEQIRYAQSRQNNRLLSRAADGYVWNMTNQILQIREACSSHPEYSTYEVQLAGELRQILKDGFQGRKYPFNRKNLELFEVAYPLPLWNVLHQIYGKLKKSQ